MRASYAIAIVVGVAAIAWIASGLLGEAPVVGLQKPAVSAKKPAAPKVRVRVKFI